MSKHTLASEKRLAVRKVPSIHLMRAAAAVALRRQAAASLSTHGPHPTTISSDDAQRQRGRVPSRFLECMGPPPQISDPALHSQNRSHRGHMRQPPPLAFPAGSFGPSNVTWGERERKKQRKEKKNRLMLGWRPKTPYVLASPLSFPPGSPTSSLFLYPPSRRLRGLRSLSVLFSCSSDGSAWSRKRPIIRPSLRHPASPIAICPDGPIAILGSACPPMLTVY